MIGINDKNLVCSIYILEIIHSLKEKEKNKEEDYDKNLLEPTRPKMAKDLT